MLVSKVCQCQATKHETAYSGPFMRDPVALIIRRPSVQVRPAPLVFPQVIPEGPGPCQGRGDLRFGLSSTAAHTSK